MCGLVDPAPGGERYVGLCAGGSLAGPHAWVWQLVIPGDVAFRMWDTYGLSIEEQEELLASAGGR